MTNRRFPKFRLVSTVRWFLPALAAAAVLAIGGSHLSTGPAEGVEGKAPATRVPVRGLALTPSESYETVEIYTGQVSARRRSAIGFERTGRVVRIEVDDGERVAAEQVVAMLDTSRLEAERRRLVAQRDAARALLEEMRNGPRPEAIDRAQSRLAASEARYERLKRLADRLRTETLEKAVARDRVDAALFDAEAARNERDAARSRLDELLAGTRQETLAAQAATARALEAQLQEIDVQLRRSVLRAPFAGTVERRFVDEGTVASAGDPVVSVVEDKLLEVRIGLPVRLVGAVEIGTTQEVTIDDVRSEGTVAAILPTLDAQTRTVEVVIRLRLPAGPRVFPGQIARLPLRRTVRERGFWVPVTALIKGRRGLWALYQLVDETSAVSPIEGEPRISRVQRVEVEILHHGNHRAYVRGPLVAGQKIIPAGVHKVVNGQRVRVVPGTDLLAATEIR